MQSVYYLTEKDEFISVASVYVIMFPVLNF
jgi:hypothetical protein